MKIKFTVYAEPYGKKNMKPVFMSGHQSLVQPKTNDTYMALVKSAYIEEADKHSIIFYAFSDNSPLELKINAYFQMPKKFSKKKVELALSGMLRPTKKPDCDNISKIICDSLNKLAFRDDSQIVRLIIEKHYAKVPRVEIEISDEFVTEKHNEVE